MGNFSLISASAPEVSSAMRSLESPETTFHSSSKLVLVHAVALNAKNGLDTALTRDGFLLRLRFRNLKPLAILAFVLLLLPCSLFPISGAAQRTSAVTQSPGITFHSSSELVLVDVIARNAKNGLPDKTLKESDFQVFDNDQPVAFKTFDSGAQFTTRPLALWFVVQCNMQGYEGKGSGLFTGQISRFEPALKYIEKQDTVAVAHWCDDGRSNLDLLPTRIIKDAPILLEQALATGPDTKTHDRAGELALQSTLQHIVDTTRSSKPEPLPVLIFLYGDYSSMNRSEANHFIDELLETSAIAFGVRDHRSQHLLFAPGEQRAIAHYMATQTGGQYFDASPETYASALAEILQQLHFRYELRFKPEALDGKRHKLRVQFADTVKDQRKAVRLRYRLAYVPIPPGVR